MCVAGRPCCSLGLIVGRCAGRDPDVKGLGLDKPGNAAAAAAVGRAIAEKAKGAGIQGVVFDRGGFSYHGRLKAFADAAREAGLKF